MFPAMHLNHCGMHLYEQLCHTWLNACKAVFYCPLSFLYAFLCNHNCRASSQKWKSDSNKLGFECLHLFIFYTTPFINLHSTGYTFSANDEPPRGPRANSKYYCCCWLSAAATRTQHVARNRCSRPRSSCSETNM